MFNDRNIENMAMFLTYTKYTQFLWHFKNNEHFSKIDSGVIVHGVSMKRFYVRSFNEDGKGH